MRRASVMAVRAAVDADAAALCAVLNPIIALGGTTAHRQGFEEARMTSHYVSPAYKVSCFLAEEDGVVVGFQSLVWVDERWATIATFVAPGVQGRGIGAALFAATLRAAQAAGVASIDATIRTENVVGHRYYGGLGFEPYRERGEQISRRFEVGAPLG